MLNHDLPICVDDPASVLYRKLWVATLEVTQDFLEADTRAWHGVAKRFGAGRADDARDYGWE